MSDEGKIEGTLVLREKMRRRDLKLPELREHYWDQVHPKTGRFRSKYYQNSLPWLASSETFIEREEQSKPNFPDWVRGTYNAKVTISDGSHDKESDIVVSLKLSLDFTKDRENCVHWEIDTRTSEIHKPAAYPGFHNGYLSVLNSSGFSTFWEVAWSTPIFSPYVEIKAPYRGNDRADFTAVTFQSTLKSRGGDVVRESPQVEKVYLAHRGVCYVIVLQEVLKDLARLLVFGPRYTDMKLAPVAEYTEAFIANHLRNDASKEFFDSAQFPEAALLFSRAYCQLDLGEEDDEEHGTPVPRDTWMKSVETIEKFFDHYKIVRDPPWIETSKGDWVDELEEEAKSLKTMADWRKFERKWATITSYACGLNLHEGPWIGEGWQNYIDLAI